MKPSIASLLLLLLLCSACLAPLVSAVPTQVATQLQARAGPKIPDPRRSPPKPKGDGAGRYNSMNKTRTARFNKKKFRAMAGAAKVLGMKDAARHMNHYLDNTGKELTVSVERLLDDLKDFKGMIADIVDFLSKPKYEELIKLKKKKSFRRFASLWGMYDNRKHFTDNWFFAVGVFAYSVTGVVTLETPATKGNKAKVSVDYKIHVFDRYNWDDWKTTSIIEPFIRINDRDLAELHLQGLAKEYIIRGISKKKSIPNYKPGKGVPKPSGGGRRS